MSASLSPSHPAGEAGPEPIVSVVIPNWNGRAFLARCLAATLRSLQVSGLSGEVIVVDDASSDGSHAIAGRDFAGRVTLIRNEANQGFGAGVNQGAAAARGEILILLNNDLVAKEPLVGELAGPLIERAELFGVTGKALEWDGASANHLNMSAKWDSGRGRLALHWSDPPEPAPAMFLLGGCCAMRRREFLDWGGFASPYAPGYWEDYDISYQALKRGWRNLYNPRAQAYHFGQGSMTRALGEDRLRVVKARNALFFEWLNLSDARLVRAHALGLPKIGWRAMASRSAAARADAKGLLRALRDFSAALEIRKARAAIQRTDADILREFADVGRPSAG